MRKLIVLLLAITGIASATTTVTGHIANLGAGAVSSAFVRFWLRGCGGNQPRVTSVGIVGPSQGGVFYFDMNADASGNVSGSLYSNRDLAGTGNGEIECGGSYTATWYGMQVFVNGKGGPETSVYAKNTATLDVSSVTPITTNPVVTAPTGDSTYARIDGGNTPFVGPVQFQALSTMGTGAVAFGLTPQLFSVQHGSSGSPITSATGATPTIQLSKWDATPASTVGYGDYLVRATLNTAVAQDNQSAVAIGAFVNGFGTNVVGIPNETVQVAILANATAPSANGDNPVEAINSICNSQYTGGRTSQVVCSEADITTPRAPGVFNQAGATYSPAYSAIVASGSNSATAGLIIDSSQASKGFNWGVLCEACIQFGFGTVTNTTTPDTGVYVGSASTFGVYVGGISRFTLNPGVTLSNPTIGIALGERGATSSSSNKLRFTATDGASAQHHWDFFETSDKILHLQADGSDELLIDNNGNGAFTGNVSAVKFSSSQATGSAPLIIASTTPVANLTTVPTTYNAAGTQQTLVHIVEDRCTLGTSCAVTLAGSAAFTNATSYNCTCSDTTAIAACRVNQTAGNGVTFTGTGTDVILYHCIGN